MRVLFVIRPNAYERHGGDVAVAEGSAAALRAAGAHVEMVTDVHPNPRGFDLAHVFGITDPEQQTAQLEALHATGIPLVVSPIWWDRSALFAIGPRLVRALRDRNAPRVDRRIAHLREREDLLGLRAGRGAERRLAEQRRLLQMAHLAITASEIEAYACGRILRVLDVPYVVAPYGLDPGAFDVDRAADRKGVICVGRIERLKNQALLLFALRDVDVEITLIGRSYDREYMDLCRRWATPRTRFIDRVPYDTLRDLLARSAVHALPSWGDLPGLVSLEAAAAGAHVVAGNRGSEREYLGPDVEYADPADPASIRDAVLRALKRAPRTTGDELEQRVRTFRWERHATIVRKAYERVLAGNPVR